MTNAVLVAGREALIEASLHQARDQRTRHRRAQILARVESGEINTDHAAAELAVTRTRVNQLLRKRRNNNAPEPLTTTMIATLDTPRRQRVDEKRARPSSPCSPRQNTTDSSAR